MGRSRSQGPIQDLFFNWVYWGDIGWQNQIGFNCTTQ